MPSSSKLKIVKLPSGERAEVHADGERHLIPEHSGAAKVAAHMERAAEPHSHLHEIKHVRIAAKKARQSRKGWPSDKSPI